MGQTFNSNTDYTGIADFSSRGSHEIIQQDMTRISYFNKKFGSGQVARKFDTERYPFRKVITDLLFEKGILGKSLGDTPPPLEDLHHHLTEDQMALDRSGISQVASQFYELNKEFNKIYCKFLQEYVCDGLFKEDLIYQQNPTIRFYFPKAKGFTWKPVYHTDIMLGHPPQEINIWFPLTRIFGSNSMGIASLEDSLEIFGRYNFNFNKFAVGVQEDKKLQDDLEGITKSIIGDYGEITLFDSRCIHVLQNNQTNITRVSIDIRVVPVREFESLKITYVGTGRRKMPFTKGEYYSKDVKHFLLKE